jgi:hypothetical protein
MHRWLGRYESDELEGLAILAATDLSPAASWLTSRDV